MIDFSLSKDKTVLSDKFDILLQEIDALFDASKGDLCGKMEYATDFERYLWNLNISTGTISNYVETTIKEKCDADGLTVSASTSAGYGTETDIILIDITVSDDTNSVDKHYRIG